MTQTHTPAQRRRAWWTAGVAGMASYMDAGAIVTTGTALTLYREEFGFSEFQYGQLSALLTAMIAVGALVGGYLSDRFGRRRVFTLTLMLYVLAAGVMVFAPDTVWLYVGILLLGLSSGADLPASLAMIAESAPEGEEGKFVTLSHVMWMVVIPIVNVMGIFAGNMGVDGARFMYAHLLGVAVIVVILRWRLPESTLWKEKTEAVSAGAIDKASLKVLLGPTYIWALIGISMFYGIQNIAANSNGQFAVYLFTEVGGASVSMASGLNLVAVLIGLLGTFVVLRFADTSWRMPLFFIGTVLACVAWALPGVLGVSAATVFFMAAVFWFAQQPSGEPLFKIWSQEVFPTEYRGAAQGVAIAFTRALAAGAGLITPLIIAESASLFFFSIAGVTLVAGLIGWLWVSRLPHVIRREKARGPQSARVLAQQAEADAGAG